MLVRGTNQPKRVNQCCSINPYPDSYIYRKVRIHKFTDCSANSPYSQYRNEQNDSIADRPARERWRKTCSDAGFVICQRVRKTDSPEKHRERDNFWRNRDRKMRLDSLKRSDPSIRFLVWVPGWREISVRERRTNRQIWTFSGPGRSKQYEC